MLLRNVFVVVFLFSTINAFSQQQTNTYDSKQVVDSTYGIIIYEKLNKNKGGDSIRKTAGKPLTGWEEDYYTTGKLLHKGYYLNGQLIFYKNYYENGQLERNFKAIDDYKSSAKLYYPNGNLKYDAVYKDKIEIKAKQYYENGHLEFVEELDKSGVFYSKRENYFENGFLETKMELKNKKKMLFSCQEFYETNVLKEEGDLFFNAAIRDFQKEGLWKIYSEEGKLITEQTYTKGELISEKKY